MSEIFTTENIIIGFIIVVFTLLPVGVYVFRKQVKAYEKNVVRIAERLGAQVIKKGNTTRLTGRHSGVPYQIIYEKVATQKHAYINVFIRLKADNPAQMCVSKESILDKIGQKLSIVSDVITNDVQFDQKFTIATDTPDDAEKFLDPKRRQLICEIYNQPVTSIEIRTSYLEIRIERKSFENIENIGYQAIAGMLDSLAGIVGTGRVGPASSLPDQEPGYAQKKRARKNIFFILAFAVILGLIFWARVQKTNRPVPSPLLEEDVTLQEDASGLPVYYEDTPGSFSMAFPSGWTVNKGDGKNYNVSARSPHRDGIVVRVKGQQARAFEHMTDEGLADYIDLIDSRMRMRWPDAGLMDSGMTELDGEKAIYTEHRYFHKKSNAKLRQLVIEAQHDGMQYFITCYSREDRYEEQKSFFIDAVESLKFTAYQ